jgi:hypothetical protein
VCTQGCTLRAMALGVQICGGVLLPAAAAANGRGPTTPCKSPHTPQYARARAGPSG